MILGTGCHYHESVRPLSTPSSWRTMFRECGNCHGRKVWATVTLLGNVGFWVCVPCTERAQAHWRAIGWR